MALTARANWVINQAYLNSDFGLALASKKLNKTPEEIEALVGRFTKGKRKGQLRGMLQWIKITDGGWVKTGPYDWDAMQGQGFVIREIGATFAYRIVESWTGKPIFHGLDSVPDSNDDRRINLEQSYFQWRTMREKQKTA